MSPNEWECLIGELYYLQSNWERKNCKFNICSREGRIGTVDPVHYLAVVPDVSTTHLNSCSRFLLNFFNLKVLGILCHLGFWREEGGIERGLSAPVNAQGCLCTFATEKEKNTQERKSLWATFIFFIRMAAFAPPRSVATQPGCTWFTWEQRKKYLQHSKGLRLHWTWSRLHSPQCHPWDRLPSPSVGS